MLLLGEIRVLSALPKIELAKLTGEAEEVFLGVGQTVDIGDSVFLVSAGSLQLRPSDAPEIESLSLAEINPGEIVGEWALLGEYDDDPPVVVAVTDCHLYRISVDRWQSITEHYPEVSQRFQVTMLQRLRDMQRNLARYKRYLHTYANEFWTEEDIAPDSPERSMAQISVAVVEQPPSTEEGPDDPEPPAAETRAQRSPKKPTWLAWTASVLCIAAGVGTWVLFDGKAATLASITLILVWTAVNWYLNVIPEYAVALAACLMTVILGITGVSDTFSGFADSSWFLLLGAFGLGVSIQKSGLLYRGSLHLLRILPPTYVGQSVALALAGTLLTPALPAVQSRITMAGLLSRELSETMRFRPRSKGAAGLAMSAFLGFGQMRFMFLNGSSYSLLAWGLMPLVFRQTASWFQWLLVATPLALLTLVSTFWVTVYWMFREDGAVVNRSMIDRQLRILGKMSLREAMTMWVTLAVVVGFLTQSLHHIDASWIALGGFLVLIATGIVEKEEILTKIDWQYMLFYGSLAGMVMLVNKSDLSKLLAEAVTRYLSPLFGNVLVFLLIVGVLTILLRMVFQPSPAIIVAGLTFFPVAVHLGYNPLVVAIIIVAASTSWVVPQLLNSYTTMYATTQGRCFDHKQVKPLALVHSIILLAAIAASTPIWHLLGLLTVR